MLFFKKNYYFIQIWIFECVCVQAGMFIFLSYYENELVKNYKNPSATIIMIDSKAKKKSKAIRQEKNEKYKLESNY